MTPIPQTDPPVEVRMAEIVFPNHTNHMGDALGGGVTYGYSFVLSRRWSLETTIGLGMLHVREKKFAEGTTEPKEINHTKTIPAPLKAGITFTYILK